MTRDMMLGMLRAGNTGDELLDILDAMVCDSFNSGSGVTDTSFADSYGEPTTEWVEF
jgi:hypothetical protein